MSLASDHHRVCGFTTLPNGKTYCCYGRDPNCERCASYREYRIGTHVSRRIKQVALARLYHVTLTWHGGLSNDELREQTRAMSAAFSRIRERCVFWRKHVLGGCWGRDASFNEGARTWNPHLHVAIEFDGDGAAFHAFSQKLHTAWNKHSRIGFDVRIQSIDTPEHAENLARYLGKSPYKSLKGKGDKAHRSTVCTYKELTKGLIQAKSFGSWGDCKVSAKLNPQPQSTTEESTSVVEHGDGSVVYLDNNTNFPPGCAPLTPVRRHELEQQLRRRDLTLRPRRVKERLYTHWLDDDPLDVFHVPLREPDDNRPF